MDPVAKILILGIGNTLRGDDGVGVRVVEALDDSRAGPCGMCLRDGGTLGLSLLTDFEDADAVIAIDAAEIGAAPGAVALFEGAAMDRQLGGKKGTAHEVALADLMSAAHLMGWRPERRALVAIQPGVTDWSMTPSAPVAAAIVHACAMVRQLINRWNDAG
jgi:hydrogenase maturation protease